MRYVVTFPERFRYTPHPVFGMRPQLPDEVVYFEIDTTVETIIGLTLNEKLGDDWLTFKPLEYGDEGKNVVARIDGRTGEMTVDPSVRRLTKAARDVINVLNGHSPLNHPNGVSCICSETTSFFLMEEFNEHVALMFMKLREDEEDGY